MAPKELKNIPLEAEVSREDNIDLYYSKYGKNGTVIRKKKEKKTTKNKKIKNIENNLEPVDNAGPRLSVWSYSSEKIRVYIYLKLR